MSGNPETSTSQGSRRRSVFDFFKKRASVVQDKTYRKLHGYDRPNSTIASLLSLPTELLLLIVVDITFSDLISMRATCRTAQELLSKGDLLQEWMLCQTLRRHEVEPGDHITVYAQLYPPTNGITIEYLLSRHRRISAAALMAMNLEFFVERFICRHSEGDAAPSSPIVYMICPEYAQLQDKLVPCLLVIQHYLENLRSKMGDLAIARWTDTTAIWARLQEVTFQIYKREDIVSAHETFQVLCWLMARLLDPSGYRARRIMVLGKRALSDEDVRQFVVLANLRGIAELVEMDSYKAREKKVLQMVRSHDPMRNKDWLYAWSAHRPEYNPVLQPPQTMDVLNLHFGFQDVWMRAATEYLARHKLRGREMNILEADGSSRRTVDGYTDIAGKFYQLTANDLWYFTTFESDKLKCSAILAYLVKCQDITWHRDLLDETSRASKSTDMRTDMFLSASLWLQSLSDSLWCTRQDRLASIHVLVAVKISSAFYAAGLGCVPLKAIELLPMEVRAMTTHVCLRT